MGKFKTGLVKEYKEQQKSKLEQEKLREKHNIDENLVVVEKSFILKYISAAIKTLAQIILFILATIGLLGLIYPTIRQELWLVLNDIILQLKMMIGW